MCVCVCVCVCVCLCVYARVCVYTRRRRPQQGTHTHIVVVVWCGVGAHLDSRQWLWCGVVWCRVHTLAAVSAFQRRAISSSKVTMSTDVCVCVSE